MITAEEYFKKYGWKCDDTQSKIMLERAIEFAKLHIEEFQKSELSFTEYLKTIK